MMKIKILIYSVFTIFFFSCGNYSEQNNKASYSPGSDMDYMLESEEMIYKKENLSKNETSELNDDENIIKKTKNIAKKIIKTANISFGVSDYKKSKPNIIKIIKKNKAYVASENENNNSYSISNTIVIRVPAENFEKLLSDLEGEAENFESKSINTSDVTEEYVDLITRIENKKKVEAQYIELLKKARKISEILEVNEHVRKLREEIEAKEGRLRYLKNQVGLSSITLYVHQDYDTVSYGFFHKVGNALSGGWEGFLTFLLGLLYIWPVLIIFGLIGYFVRKTIKKKAFKKKQD